MSIVDKDNVKEETKDDAYHDTLFNGKDFDPMTPSKYWSDSEERDKIKNAINKVIDNRSFTPFVDSNPSDQAVANVIHSEKPESIPLLLQLGDEYEADQCMQEWYEMELQKIDEIFVFLNQLRNNQQLTTDVKDKIRIAVSGLATLYRTIRDKVSEIIEQIQLTPTVYAQVPDEFDCGPRPCNFSMSLQQKKNYEQFLHSFSGDLSDWKKDIITKECNYVLWLDLDVENQQIKAKKVLIR